MSPYWMKYGWRWLLMLTFSAYGYVEQGPVGIFYGLLLFGLLAFVFYAIFDMVGAIGNFIRPQQNVNVYVQREEHPDVEGKFQHRDPTRPREGE